jgi:hypothetical protein
LSTLFYDYYTTLQWENEVAKKYLSPALASITTYTDYVSLRVGEVVPVEAAAAVRTPNGIISPKTTRDLNVTTMNLNFCPRRRERSSGLPCAKICPTVSVSLGLEGRF